LSRRLLVPNFENATMEEVECAIYCTPTRQASERLRAIWCLGKQVPREHVVTMSLTNETTLVEWIKAFNKAGIDGLVDKARSGRPRKIPRAQVVETVLPLLAEPERAGQTHWTAVKLHGHLREELKTVVSYSTLVRYLHEENQVLRVPRPWPVEQDEERRAAFAKQLQAWVADPSVELWFADECGIEADPRPRRRWVEKGSSPTVPYTGDHLRANVLGAVAPQSGRFCSLIFDHCNTDVFQVLLDTMAVEVPAQPNKRMLLIVDNASWHKATRLNWHHFEPVYLPPYSPDFNPIERLWLHLKANWFADFFTRDPDILEERLITALRSLYDTPEKIQSQCSIPGNF
jgi:transposase